MIPLYIMEEHNEAFLYWHQFIRDGLIPPAGNYLLHIDHHDDFEGGGYRFDPNHIPGDNMEEIRRITYRDLGIANFIAPAVYEKIFSTVHIVKNLAPAPLAKDEMVARCPDGKFLSCAKYLPFLHSEKKQNNESGYAFFNLLENGLGDIRIDGSLVPECGYVLDLDLDYFCWDNSLSTVKRKLLEITPEAYREVTADKYHPFRLFPVAMVFPVEIDGKYYLEYREELPPDKLPSRERILKRIENLMAWLKAQPVSPAVIDICTSRFSGYLPADAYPFVKDEVLKALECLQE